MSHLKYPHTENRKGKKTRVHGKTVNGSENPHVGIEIGHFRRDARQRDIWGGRDAQAAMAYLLEEYGDQALDEAEEMEQDELREYILDIERRHADDDIIERREGYEEEE